MGVFWEFWEGVFLFETLFASTLASTYIILVRKNNPIGKIHSRKILLLSSSFLIQLTKKPPAAGEGKGKGAQSNEIELKFGLDRKRKERIEMESMRRGFIFN